MKVEGIQGLGLGKLATKGQRKTSQNSAGGSPSQEENQVPIAPGSGNYSYSQRAFENSLSVWPDEE